MLPVVLQQKLATPPSMILHVVLTVDLSLESSDWINGTGSPDHTLFHCGIVIMCS